MMSVDENEARTSVDLKLTDSFGARIKDEAGRSAHRHCKFMRSTRSPQMSRATMKRRCGALLSIEANRWCVRHSSRDSSIEMQLRRR